MTVHLASGTRRGPGRPSRRPLAGTRRLLEVSMRHDVLHLAPWIAFVTALSASSVLAYAWIFPSQEDRLALSASLGVNPTLGLVLGRPRDLLTADGFTAWRAGQLGAFFAGLMAVLAVVRNSRALEDSGRAELVAAGVVARASRLAVAVAVGVLAGTATGVVSYVVTVLCGGDPVSTLVLSAGFTVSAWLFAGVAAVACQVGADARSASSLAMATLGSLYVLRGWTDSSDFPGWTSWLTPFGWIEQSRPASGDHAWPLVLTAAVAVVLAGVAFVLHARRDFGQGLVGSRSGRARAGLAGTVWGLVVKLHLGSGAAWVLGLAVLGFLFGTLVSSVGDVLFQNPTVTQVLAQAAGVDLTLAFLTTLLGLAGIVAGIAGVQVVARVRSEEVELRLEPLLAGSLRRSTYLAANAVVALVLPALALLVAGTTMGLAAHARQESVAVVDVVTQAVVTVPAVWVLVALALAAVGARPRATALGWVGVVATFALTLLGPTFRMPDWALDVSPLRHVPTVGAPDPGWWELAALGGVAAAFLVVAFVGFRHRDVG